MVEERIIQKLREKIEVDIPKIVEGFITELPGEYIKREGDSYVLSRPREFPNGKQVGYPSTYKYPALVEELKKRVNNYLKSQWLNAESCEEKEKVYNQVMRRGRGLQRDAINLAYKLFNKWLMGVLSETK